jgi:hypothetical protein
MSGLNTKDNANPTQNEKHSAQISILVWGSLEIQFRGLEKM